MEMRQKKMAAALAAVNAYLQQEESQVATTPSEPALQLAQVAEGGWVISGRMEMMTMRRLIQMRAFGRIG